MMQTKIPIVILQSVDSTNNYAMRQVHAGLAQHGQAWLALEQTNGKGQGSKQWQAAKGDNITMSTILNTSALQIQQQFRFSATIAAACHAFLKSYAGNHVFIKWPNDIYWNDRKAGGILIENVLQGKTWKWAIAGTGLNINQTSFSEHLPNPVSLQIITGQSYPIEKLASELHQKLLFYWQQLSAGNWPLIYNYYNSYLYKAGEQIRIHVNGRSITATLKGISEEGLLTIEESDEDFSYDDVKVEWQVPAPSISPNGGGNGEE